VDASTAADLTFHGGGFHAGAFHGGGFHGAGFHGGFAGLHNGFAGGHEGHWYGWLAWRALRLVVGRSRTVAHVP
jgi:hypothetical protein